MLQSAYEDKLQRRADKEKAAVEKREAKAAEQQRKEQVCFFSFCERFPVFVICMRIDVYVYFQSKEEQRCRAAIDDASKLCAAFVSLAMEFSS